MIESLTTNDTADQLTVHWEGGERSSLPAAILRREAQDAWTIRERIDHGEVAVRPGISILELRQIGANGVNIRFSDGHDKAIFPFPYLRELSDRFDK